MAEQQPGVWGIDIGQCALKALRLEINEGQVTATAFDYVEHPKILSQPDADPDQLVREALEKFLSRNTLRGDQVAVSVPGQSGLARFVKLPPVEEKKIPDIVRFEAKQQIPFPLDEVVWDYQKIGSGTVTDGFAMETEIGLFAIKRDTVNRALQQFKDVNIEVHLVQMAPLALSNFLAFDLLNKVQVPGAAAPETPEPAAKPKGLDKQCVVALDIGTDNSNLVITDGERVIWQRPIPFGGNHFTRALTKDLKLTFAKAEHLKRNATKSPDLKKILTALKPVLNDFVGEVQRSLGYFTNTHRNASVAYMVGLGNAFRLPGLQKFLSEKLQLEVRKLAKMERLTGEEVVAAPVFTQNLLSFATAYGLALQGLKLGRLQTNLLPQDIQFERMIRAKKPWAAAGAAVLLLGVLAGTVYYALQYRAYAATSVQDAIKDSKPVIDNVASDQRKFQEREKKIEEKERSIRKIIAGQAERLNWVLLNEYVNECMPVPGMRLDGKIKDVKGKSYVVEGPDGKAQTFGIDDTSVYDLKTRKVVAEGNLKPGLEAAVIYHPALPPKTRPYWTAGARDAYFKLSEREAAGKKGDSRIEQLGLNQLIQVNVETVIPVYSRDLKAYFDKVKDEVTKNKGTEFWSKWVTKEEETKTPAEGKGWVVEIRGYTYHQGGYEFLRDTIVENLKDVALKERGVAAPKEGSQALEKDKKPTPAPAPTGAAGTAPADKPEAKPAPTPEQERDELWNQVIAKKIQYVILYDFKPTQPPAEDFARFELINGSVVTQLATAAATGGPTDQGMNKGLQPSLRTGSGGGTGNWQPLVPLEVGTNATARGPRLTLPTSATSGRPAVAPAPEGQPPAGTADGAPKSSLQRSEFILLFIWKEPEWKTGEIGGDGSTAGQTGTQTSNMQGGGARMPRGGS